MRGSTHGADKKRLSRPFSHQLTQLLFGEGAHNETKNKEKRKEDSQSAAHKRVQADTLVVSGIGPAGAEEEEEEDGFNIIYAVRDILETLETHCTFDQALREQNGL